MPYPPLIKDSGSIPVPQYWDGSNWVVQTEAKLAAMEADLAEIKDNQTNGTQEVKATLYGTNVEELVLQDSLAIADTNERSIDVDLGKYEYWVLRAFSNLNQSISLRLTPATSVNLFKVWDGESFEDTEITLPSVLGFYVWTMPKSSVWVGENRFRWVCSTAPSSGTFSLRFWGVKL